MAIPANQYQGSFRGVEFHSSKSDGEIGRRNKVYEYPFKDEADSDDFGRKTRTFSLDIFVIGDNLIQKRDALEAAFEKAGPGILVHPWRGRMQVVVTDCRPTETIQQIGRFSWTVTFSQVGNTTQPSLRHDTGAVVIATADNSLAAVENDFAQSFTVEGMPTYVEADALTRLDNRMSEILSIARGSLPDMQALPSFISQSQSILNKATQLIRLPQTFAATVTGHLQSLMALPEQPLTAFRSLMRFVNDMLGIDDDNNNGTIDLLTVNRQQQLNNQNAFESLVRISTLITAATATTNIEFESQDQAIAVRDEILSAIETEQLTAPDQTFHALSDLRAAVVNDIDTRAIDLAKLIQYTPAATLPAEVLAYSLYGDATKAEEIVTRNRVEHPGFVPGGKALEILVK